ncbi:hypothetical protein K4L06_19690 [Lysobacter sp. BMK333-48F3]|uniref:hypothetical protein n=1 Tax=Lysobacter sp. BMK333-48F3 TaxID=2867962 RepID=UPI001C8C570E|nr:hypothetical protein [Lysobacter sp. BMK333-48F3]MBX9403540.1 hypothetical protein [Lysobacter sp. BMK333-48F3]
MNSPASLKPAMAISPELQAKIDALDNEKLRDRILSVLTGPGKRTASDEDIYENMVSNHKEFQEQQARTRKWRDDEVVAFAQYLSVVSPEDYADFLHQQREFNHIDAELGWDVRRWISVWAPKLDYFLDAGELFGDFRTYIEATFCESALESQATDLSISPELQARIDALEEKPLRDRLRWVLAAPAHRRADDEATFQIVLSADALAKQQLAGVESWSEDELAEFTRFFRETWPEDHAELLRQQDPSLIGPELASSLQWLLACWAPVSTMVEIKGLFRQYRNHLKTAAPVADETDRSLWERTTPVDPELQAKIDAIENAEVKARVLRLLSCPWRGHTLDSAIYSLVTSEHEDAEIERSYLEEWGDKEQWRIDGEVSFAEYFRKHRPQDYAEFQRQAKESSEIAPQLRWDVSRLLREWIMDLSSSDHKMLIGRLRDYLKSH